MKISKVLIEQNQIEQKVKELAERINKDYLGEELVIVGILKGAFIVISDIAKQLDVDVTFEFMSIQSYEGTKSTGQIKIDNKIIWIPGIRKSDLVKDFDSENNKHTITSSIEKSNFENI